MQAWLSNPAFQAAGAPFLAALLLGVTWYRRGPGVQGLAIVAGFLLAAALITGLSLQPLTSTRKIILSGAGLPLLVLLTGFFPRVQRTALWRWLPSALLVAAAVWIIWPVLQRQEGLAVVHLLAPVLLFSALVSVAMVRLASRQAPLEAFNTSAAALLMLALGVGAACLIAASALYSQLAFAVAAATGGVVSVARWGSTPRWEVAALHAASMPVILLAAAATVFAKLPILVLLCLALVPLFAVLPLPRPSQPWPHLIVSCLWAAIPVLPGLWLTWRAAGPISF